ncbi:TPA: tRNA preQ1(34) S-adenosylmethionine ribosyltransferase-isomerase QueA [Candidatus Falkowbacteria bacterium]|nr:tRNA preQ1(34) S-adenosylmethionine ribosyltransferase-isomerase QueA [Candidatus Falkowbacteria bacterium]
MKVSDFNYHLPPTLIASHPATPRDSCKLLIYDSKEQKVTHQTFNHLPDYLRPGDLLILNDTKVRPARLHGFKAETGGKIEFLLLKNLGYGEWETMIRGHHLKPGSRVNFPSLLSAVLITKIDDKSWRVKFNVSEKKFEAILNRFGETPIPPYIHPSLKTTDAKLKSFYQTIYARQSGSAAAPTAGLHFTSRLLTKIKKQGIGVGFLTLHVGLGTFSPVTVDDVEKHQLHAEAIEIKSALIKKIRAVKKTGGRVIAVGTTSVRTLEALAPDIISTKPARTIKREINIFIYPGYKFKVIDAMITNFHLPQSSLLMLVSAFIGREKTLELYNLAIKKKYRFYSFGDAMFLQ